MRVHEASGQTVAPMLLPARAAYETFDSKYDIVRGRSYDSMGLQLAGQA